MTEEDINHGITNDEDNQDLNKIPYGLQDNPMRASIPILTDDRLDVGLGDDTQEELKSDKPENLQDLFVSEHELEQLWSQIAVLEDQVIKEVNNVELGVIFIKNLEDARKRIISGEDQFDEVSGILAEIEYRLKFSKKVNTVSKKVGIPLFIYELIWIIVFVFFLFWLNINDTYFQNRLSSDILNSFILVNSMVWGGFGGVVGALYALWKHIAADQDFDPQFSLWYITNPILGISLGGFVYLLIQAGFFSLTAGTSNGEAIQSAAVIYVFAWICGFKQNVIYEIVRRVLDVFRVDTDDVTQN